MATHTSASGVIKVGSNAVAEVTGFSIEHSGDTVEDTVIGDSARTYLHTLKSFTATIDCFWDETDTDGQEDIDVGDSLTFNIYPEGDSSGDAYYSGTGIVTGMTVSTAVGEMITRTFSIQGSGDLTHTTV